MQRTCAYFHGRIYAFTLVRPLVSYHRPKSGHITCYLNRTDHVLLTTSTVSVDSGEVLTYRSCHSLGPGSNSESDFPRNRGRAVHSSLETMRERPILGSSTTRVSQSKFEKES
jgi:hypothetical protein